MLAPPRWAVEPFSVVAAVSGLDGDGRPDIVIGNKRGGFVFLQQPPGR